MRNITCFLLFIIFCLGLNTQALANTQDNIKLIRNANDTASGIPAMPYKVVINQQNANVYAQCLARIIVSHGQKVLVLPFPKAAEDIQLFLPEYQGKEQGKIVSWSVEKALPYKPQGSIEKQRVTFESMHDSLAGALMSLKAQQSAMFEALKNKNADLALKEAEQLSPNLALVGTRIASTERQLDFAKKRAQGLQDNLPESLQLIVRIDSSLAENTEVLVDYAYTLSNTFWVPKYIFNADTTNNTISVELLAQITQNSDLDWQNVQLELSTNLGNERAPYPINPWIVRKSAHREMYSKAMPQAMLARGVANDSAVPSFDQNTALARWVLPNVAIIPEGLTIVKLSSDTWNTPLMRIARPSVSDNKVWLSATHKIGNIFYPIGEASFLLDGAVTGKGTFAPSGGEAKIFFGADPLVSVETKDESRKSAEKGIIGKEQTWNWTWNYRVENKREMAVKVRIEEAQTQAEDAAMSISYADEPKPEQGPEKTFIWNVDVPAKGNSLIKRSITVKAPSDMKLYLGR